LIAIDDVVLHFINIFLHWIAKVMNFGLGADEDGDV
jgi:hypothetical protein